MRKITENFNCLPEDGGRRSELTHGPHKSRHWVSVMKAETERLCDVYRAHGTAYTTAILHCDS